MRYLMKISYDGSYYSGFQIQPNKKTIQAELEDVMKQVFGFDISIVPSGRTDAGVSAIEQICHFDLDNNIDINKSLGYINSLLSENIRVIDINITDENFHARYSAKKKTYEYYFYFDKKIPVYDKFATFVGYNINVGKMKDACKCFCGEFDFSAFCASNTAVVDKVRIIYDIDIIKVDEQLYKLTITGNGFLYNMVRIIMGTLVDVGLGKISSDEINSIITSKDRNRAGKTISAKGLYLKKVCY